MILDGLSGYVVQHGTSDREDEFDKYHADYGRLLSDEAGFMQTLVVVSHGDLEGLGPLRDEYRLLRVPFHLRDTDGETKHVAVTVESSW